MLDWTHPVSGHSTFPLCVSCQRTSALTGRTLPASGHFQRQRLVEDQNCALTAATDRTQDPSVWSLRDQRPVHSVKPVFSVQGASGVSNPCSQVLNTMCITFVHVC